MNTVKQLLRQPGKYVLGIFVVALAVTLLVICLGQSIMALRTEAALEYQFTTVALYTTKYNYYDSFYRDFEGNEVPYKAWRGTLPDEITEWLSVMIETRTDMVEEQADFGLASAYIMELTPDNVTQHLYHPISGTQENSASYKQEANPAYSKAMLEMLLEKIGEPLVLPGSVTVELAGKVTNVLALEAGYDEPMNHTLYLTLILPDKESLEKLELSVGERYLVYGEDYRDGNWVLRGLISMSASAWLGYDFALESLDENAFKRYTQEEKEDMPPLASGAERWGTYKYGDGKWDWTELTENEIKNRNAVFMTAWDQELFTAEKNNALYSVPTIVRLNGSAEDFLQSEEGHLWAAQREWAEINYHTFPVIGVDKLGYVADFARETARIVEGRDFTQAELDSGAKVCIISENLAESNGLRVGDTVSPQFYNYDWNSPYQEFISEGKGVVNPSPYTYTGNTEFNGAAESYEIIGLYRQDDPWGDVSENPYSFTPNTVFAPKASISSDMDYSNQGFFRTLILKNGCVEEFRDLVNSAGYEDLFVYYDQGYSTIAQSLHDYQEVARRAMLVGITVYGIIMILYLFLFPGSQGSVLSTMSALGTQRRYKLAHVTMIGTGGLIPGTLIGTVTSILLWQSVSDAFAEAAGTTITMELDPVILLAVALAQLLIALALTLLMALPMTKERGIGRM